MARAKEYVWILPLFGAIIAFISLAAPAVYMNLLGMITANLWFWDLYTYNQGGIIFGTDFITELMVLIPSMITTSIIALSGVLLLISSIKLKKGSFELRNVKNFSLITGFLILAAVILWLVMVPIFFPMAYYWDAFLAPLPYTFWSWSTGFISMPLHSVGFGIIGGFMSAGIAFGGAGAASYYSKERPTKIPKAKEPAPTIKEETPSEPPSLKFCPECGAKIEDPSTKFCGKCGFEFTDVPMTQVP